VSESVIIRITKTDNEYLAVFQPEISIRVSGIGETPHESVQSLFRALTAANQVYDDEDLMVDVWEVSE
jgi:hypothetical protein